MKARIPKVLVPNGFYVAAGSSQVSCLGAEFLILLVYPLFLGASTRTLMSLLWSQEYVLKSQKARGLNSLNSNTSLLSQEQFWSCGKILLTALADWFLLVRFLMPQRLQAHKVF